MQPFVPHAVVFDMDGVLIDTRAAIEDVWRRTAQRYGRRLTKPDMTRYVHGRPGHDAVLALFADRPAEQRQEIWVYARDLEFGSGCPPVPGAAVFVQALHRAGVPLGLATSNGPARVAQVLTTLDLDGHFGYVADGTSTPRGKPHPDPYLAVAAGLGVAPDRMLVFEDSPSGLAAATAAGAVCVVVGGDRSFEGVVLDAIDDFTALRVESDQAVGPAIVGLAVRVPLPVA